MSPFTIAPDWEHVPVYRDEWKYRTELRFPDSSPSGSLVGPGVWLQTRLHNDGRYEVQVRGVDGWGWIAE